MSVVTKEQRVGVGEEKITFEEFLEWCDEDTWAEWVEGKVVMVSPASERHQDINGFLEVIMRLYAEARGLGRVLQAPFAMRTGPELPVREPDLLFVSQERLDILRETYLDGPADVVVEIVSPESRLRDRGAKFGEYELGGVREYWLIDLQYEQAKFYRLGEDGWFHAQPVDAKGVYRSEALPGFWLKPSWLWQDPLPSPVRVVAEIGGVDPELAAAFERALAGKMESG